MPETDLSYGDVLEYFDDRKGDLATVYSYPTFHLSDEDDLEAGEVAPSTPVLLGLQLSVTIVGVEAVEPFESQWLDGRAGTRIRLEAGEPGYGDGLVLTREWFTGATLDENHANLRLVVMANTAAEPLNPPVGQERNPDESKPVYMHDIVGWGFAFDFDGEAPYTGRWAIKDAD